MIRAGIDIGTNTALMVVVEFHADGTFAVLDDVHELPRLGEGLSASGRICDDAIARAMESMQRFRDVLAPYPDVVVRCVATSAMRESANGRNVASLLSGVLGHPIEIIDGAQEARLTFLGSVDASAVPTLMIDIGGGSTEYAIGANGIVTFSTSIPYGAVKFTERFAFERPVSHDVISEAISVVANSLAPCHEHFAIAEHCVGVAGTPVALAMIDKGLASYDAQLLHGHRMNIHRIAELSAFLCSLTLAELRSIPGLHERRADIVPMGSVILHASIHALGIQTIEARTTGLRYGAALAARV